MFQIVVSLMIIYNRNMFIVEVTDIKQGFLHTISNAISYIFKLLLIACLIAT